MRPLARFLLALLTAMTFLGATAFAGEPEVVKITESVYAFIGEKGATNSGFVITDRGVIVIDTQGPGELATLLKEKIRKTTDRPILFAVNTHWHGDHTFGNQFFSGAEIIAHDNTRRDLLEKDKEHRERFKKFFGEKSLDGFTLTPPTLTFKERIVLRSGGKTIVIAYVGEPAHTHGDAYVYIPQDRVVFAGDLLYKGRLPWLADGDFKGAVKGAAALLSIDAETYIPGHGPVARAPDVRAYVDYLLRLGAEVKRLKNLGKTLEEVKKEIALPEYSDYISYREWLPLNAEKVYTDLGKE